MTWVIGASPPFGGYGVMIADTQVSLADGRRLDILRKLYDVGPCLALGFAGSVRIGFRMVQSLREYLRLPADAPANTAWIPAFVAETWHSMAAAIFGEENEAERMLGCELLLVGMHPTEDVLPGNGRAYVIRMASPDFRPGYSRKRLISVLSIGCGRSVPAYRRAVRELCSVRSGTLQAEVGNLGGWGQTISFALGRVVECDPTPGISYHMHYADIRRGTITIYRNDRTDYPAGSAPIVHRMPAVASSYGEFCAMVQERGFSAAGAIC